ncbi:MAG: hypothetical protein JNL96_27805 [Planctomycetaceae bacterium]|nr:hypothetical protein [Planctomycetaceae bacterium]
MPIYSFRLAGSLLLVAAVAWCREPLAAAPPVGRPLRLITAVPQGREQLAKAFAESAAATCSMVEPGSALEMSELSAAAAESAGQRLSITVGGRAYAVPMARLPALSVGLTITPEDRTELPLLSSGLIQDYIDGHYVCLQPLVRRDLDTGELHLHDVAAAALMRYSGEAVTQGFEPLVIESLKNTRSLGLLTPTTRRPEPRQLRTLVLLTANPLIQTTEPLRTTEEYELLFLRADPGDDGSLEVRAFLAAGDQSTLHDFGSWQTPTQSAECDTIGTVYFTKYAGDGLSPTASALRSLATNSRRTIDAAALKAFAEKNGKKHWLDDAGAALDAILAGNL